jgi:hypothetical protein
MVILQAIMEAYFNSLPDFPLLIAPLKPLRHSFVTPAVDWTPHTFYS